MSLLKHEGCVEGGSCLRIDPAASAHALWNEGTELLRYARGLTAMLADLIHEAEAVNSQKMAHSLEGIDVLMQLGLECAAQAHACVAVELREAITSPAD
ncbi:hypothetical protein [Luteibacter yeojuensis]|uniref:Uncharacterized protein n=1 Tax=Luteibacter yeojuensis TaxID=345309 RepID=A0A7X5QVQ1_9GAMM|nr:hypothetical protein [Luteibacter yeojuensis]NID16251.1 hypothetical protein [Luteibacter yeojuensis]